VEELEAEAAPEDAVGCENNRSNLLSPLSSSIMAIGCNCGRQHFILPISPAFSIISDDTDY